MADFDKLYKKLNDKQKKAVDTIDGPVMIIAGPGTGKTLTLTMRIANILKKTDTSPNSILALTFTESGAKAMKERLVQIIGPQAYYVNISTFHSFCTDLIREFPELFLLPQDTTPLSELERIQIFKQIIDEAELDTLKPVNSPYYYLNSIISSIQDIKREGLTTNDFEKLVNQEEARLVGSEKKINPRTNKPYAKYKKQKRELAKQKELVKIYQKYEEKLSKTESFDFEDMINFVIEKLTINENFKLTLQERYLYILVDEYQDTNSAQNEIIKLLTDHWDDPNIFVVGDDEQSIYRFQGASLENILYFKKLFENAEVITLTSNYRSSQFILDASRELIEKNKLKLEEVDKSLKSKIKRSDIPISIAKFSVEETESAFIAERIKNLIKSGTDPDKIAVLVRNNSDIDIIKQALITKDIRFEVSSGKDILQDGDINRLLLLLKTINDLNDKPDEDVELFTLLNYDFLDFNKLDILKLSRFASQKSKNLLDTIIDEDLFGQIDLQQPKKFIQFIENLNKWKTLDANTSFIKFFESVIKESGFLEWILSDKIDVSRVNKLNVLFDEIKNLNRSDHSLNLEKFLENVQLMRENNIKLAEKSIGLDTESVKLLTAHKSKGLEFDYVFIAKCVDKKWGNKRRFNAIKLPEGIIENTQTEKKEQNEDERRLFYVALTRAKKQIFITYAEKYKSYGYIRDTTPSMFIAELNPKYISREDTKKFEKKFSEDLQAQLALPDSQEESIKLEDFVNKFLSNFKLSVTSLNTYLKCHYKFLLNNILRTPRAKPVYLAFGTAIHKSLEEFFKKLKNTEKLPSLQYLTQSYKEALDREILDEEERKDLEKKGKKTLEQYFKKNKSKFEKPLYTEYSFGFRKVYLGDIPLSGKIDRVDWVNKDKKQVRVVDYKTGTPKTKGQIKGTTKDSEGDLFRQLNFYKLLAQLDYNFNYSVTEGQFQFIEPKPGKKTRTETFIYQQEDIADLKTTIKNCMKEIRNHEFEKTDEYKHCYKCDYKNHCWPDGIPQE